jgi:hypothetical protein
MTEDPPGTYNALSKIESPRRTICRDTQNLSRVTPAMIWASSKLPSDLSVTKDARLENCKIARAIVKALSDSNDYRRVIA